MTKIPYRASALWLACVLQMAGWPLEAGAQGLRPATPSATRAAPRSADYIVAVVNSEPITNNEVRARMDRLEKQFAQQGQALPPRGEFARQVLDRLISEKAQLQLARDTGLRIDTAMIDQAEQNVARQNQVDVAELRRRLAAEGLAPAQFREELRNQLLLQRLRDRELESRVKVSDLDIDQYLREQQASNEASAQELNLGHILVAVPEGASEARVAELRARAQRAHDRVRAGEDFATVAREFSDVPGAAQSGGLVGLRPADRYPPLFLQAVENVPQGGLAPIVRSGAGFHVLKVAERRKSAGVSSTVVQTHARHILLRPGAQLSESAAIQRLADFKRRVEAKQADFAQLAREFSQDASARNGGDLGWANPGLFVPEFEEALSTLSPGQIADPVISRFGVHLVQLLERREATLTQREQRDMVRNLVREKKLEEAYALWAQEVRGRAYVDLREPPQ